MKIRNGSMEGKGLMGKVDGAEFWENAKVGGLMVLRGKEEAIGGC